MSRLGPGPGPTSKKALDKKAKEIYLSQFSHDNIEVIGRFFHEDLSDNTDVNYWTNIVPMTLLKAALYQLAAFYGDVKSADRWLGLIDVEGIGLEKLKVEQDSNDARVLE